MANPFTAPGITSDHPRRGIRGYAIQQSGTGVRVILNTRGKVQMRVVAPGVGSGAQNSPKQAFELAGVRAAERLRVRGQRYSTVQAFPNVPVNRTIRLTKGQAEFDQIDCPVCPAQ